MSYFPNYPQQFYQQPPMGQLEQLRQQQYQPQYQQPQQVQQIQQSGMVWVRNRMEADNYPVAPNTAVALWDASGPFVHRKETDVSGRPMVKTFKLVEVTDAQQAEPEFVTWDKFKALAENVSALATHVQSLKKEDVPNE